MTMKEHFQSMFWDFVKAYGAVMLIVSSYMLLNGTEFLTSRNIIQLLLLTSTVLFRMESFVNFHALNDMLMRKNYLYSSVLADITLLVLLAYYTPGGKQFKVNPWMMVGAYIVFKGLVYAMVYVQALQNAKEINNKLRSV